MRNNSKSFAHEYGITQKNPSSIGIGLNPNLNIEDEYIQNLLKQTHFLNMEIKLMKQKQKQNKGMGIMGLLNKDQNPVVTHAITSNDKYAEMKNKLGSQVNDVEVEYLLVDDQNVAVKAKRDFIQRSSLKQQQKNIEHKLRVDRQLIQSNNLLKDNQKKLLEMRTENNKIKDTFERTFKDWQQITSKQKTKKLFKEITTDLQNEFQQLKKHHFEVKEQILKKNERFLKEEDEKNRQDAEYISQLQQYESLQEELKKSEKELFDKNYRVKEMQQLKKLSIRNKDFEAEAKKQAAQEAQKLKKKLSDRKTQFETKLKQSKQSLETNDDIRLLKGKVARKDKEIADLRKKTQISEKNFKNLKDQVQKLTLKLEQLKTNNLAKEQQLKSLTIAKNQTAETLNKDELDHQKLQLDLTSTMNKLVETRRRMESLQEQNTYLKAKQEHLSKQINVEEGMNRVQIEKLKSLMSNNNGLNKTITELMEKWDQIKRFSNEPPIA